MENMWEKLAKTISKHFLQYLLQFWTLFSYNRGLKNFIWAADFVICRQFEPMNLRKSSNERLEDTYLILNGLFFHDTSNLGFSGCFTLVRKMFQIARPRVFFINFASWLILPFKCESNDFGNLLSLDRVKKLHVLMMQNFEVISSGLYLSFLESFVFLYTHLFYYYYINIPKRSYRRETIRTFEIKHTAVNILVESILFQLLHHPPSRFLSSHF